MGGGGSTGVRSPKHLSEPTDPSTQNGTVAHKPTGKNQKQGHKPTFLRGKVEGSWGSLGEQQMTNKGQGIGLSGQWAEQFLLLGGERGSARGKRIVTHPNAREAGGGENWGRREGRMDVTIPGGGKRGVETEEGGHTRSRHFWGLKGTFTKNTSTLEGAKVKELID